jgi:hypothetical protein
MKCPVCKSRVADTSQNEAHFPFCSQRCRLIDLGKWLDGEYRIPVSPEQPEDEDSQPTQEQDND